MATNANQLAKSGKFGDLRRRVVFLLLALVVYRIGAHIPVPGIDPVALQQLFKSQAGGILNLFNMFSGGALVALHRVLPWASCPTSAPASSCS